MSRHFLALVCALTCIIARSLTQTVTLGPASDAPTATVTVDLGPGVTAGPPRGLPEPEECPGHMLRCDAPDNACLHKSNKCDGEHDCTGAVVASDELACPAQSELFCADDFVKVPGANDGYCYHLKPLEEGAVSFVEALTYCNEIQAYLPRPNSVEQVEALGNWLNITGDPIPGYWMGYKRQVSAPMVNGTLSAKNREARMDKSLFVDMYSICPQVPMPEFLWRSPTQPGDMTDERDEMCVAKKRAGSAADSRKFVGADDYMCTDRTRPARHYVICERCGEQVPFSAGPRRYLGYQK